MSTSPYQRAQKALANLKIAVRDYLESVGPDGATNAEVGRALGIYHGYSSGQEGHVSRTLLSLLEIDGVAERDSETRKWKLKPQNFIPQN